MKIDLYFLFYSFIKAHGLLGKRLLLALSGGIDSMALFSLAKQGKEKGIIDFEVIHVDHGWREESYEQALTLKAWVEAEHIPFHLFQIKTQASSDKENQARIVRLDLFKQCVQSQRLEGVLLAHHSDDQAETVLKRVLEGAGVEALGGLLPIREVEGVTLIRPLLSITKSTLQERVNLLHLPIIEDTSNDDERFLRNRMRRSLLPTLEQSFGKSVKKNLNALSLVSQEITDFLKQELNSSVLDHIKGFMGEVITFTPGIKPALLRLFLKTWAQNQGQILSQEAIKAVIYDFKQGGSDKYIFTDKWVISRFQDTLLIIKKVLFHDPTPLLQEKSSRFSQEKQNWQAFIQGLCVCPYPYDQVLSLSSLSSRTRPNVNKWYSTHKVPCVLRKLAPVFLKEGEVVFEPLTGKTGLSAAAST